MLIPPGTEAFIVRMFANHSADYPDGFLGQTTLKSLYATSGPENQLVYSPGNERIPENWYTRAADNLYTLPLFVEDIITIYRQHPELAMFGGNTGTVNSFTGLNIANLTVNSLPLRLHTASCKATVAYPADIGWCL